jgi:hypothetical protein
MQKAKQALLAAQKAEEISSTNGAIVDAQKAEEAAQKALAEA